MRRGKPITEKIISEDTGDSGLIAALATHAGESERLLRELLLETSKLRASFLGSSIMNKCQHFPWWQEHSRTMREAELYLSNPAE
jgi:hypothetical protein